MEPETDGFRMRPRWSGAEYQRLLSVFHAHRVVSASEYCQGIEGLWIRHDVEIDAEAALRMARVEADAGLSATYFLCAGSPFLDEQVCQWLSLQLATLGHEVLDHLILEELAGKPDQFRSDKIVSYHSPGTDFTKLMAVNRKLGKPCIYDPVESRRSVYVSDSAGVLSDVVEQLVDVSSLQFLAHPFWWFGAESERTASDIEKFLPRYWANMTDTRTAN